MLGLLVRRTSRRTAQTLLILMFMVALVAVHAGPDASNRGAVRTASEKAWQLVPIAVSGGKAEFQIPSGEDKSQTLVIVSALSKEPGPFPVRLMARAASGVGEATRARVGPTVAHRPRQPFPTPIPDPAGAWPPGQRTFHLMVHD